MPLYLAAYSFFLMAYLSPTATLVETEILNYDFYDLVSQVQPPIRITGCNMRFPSFAFPFLA